MTLNKQGLTEPWVLQLQNGGVSASLSYWESKRDLYKVLSVPPYTS